MTGINIYVFGLGDSSEKGRGKSFVLSGFSNDGKNKLEDLLEGAEKLNISAINSLILAEVNTRVVRDIETSLREKSDILVLVHPTYLKMVSVYLKNKFPRSKVETGFEGSNQAELSVSVIEGKKYLSVEYQKTE
jgi:hypothetical protein